VKQRRIKREERRIESKSRECAAKQEERRD
jgi:hypothetical protein